MNKKCSLCTMVFNNEDPDYMKRIERHNIFHNKARIQGRNTTQGDPIYE
jgi:hypothetical protein|tara:strand:+ start:2355 stop:2501 length:147 start_codon:yes stop_codon:yes gene_type:complete